MKFLLYKAVILFLLFSVLSNCRSDPYTSKKLNGKSEIILIKELGNASGNIEFILSTDLHEYERGLLKYYPNPNGKNILIKQMAWDKKNRITIVWLHRIDSQWISFDNLSWNPKEIQF